MRRFGSAPVRRGRHLATRLDRYSGLEQPSHVSLGAPDLQLRVYSSPKKNLDSHERRCEGSCGSREVPVVMFAPSEADTGVSEGSSRGDSSSGIRSVSAAR
jgi:hypothetical protein